MSSSKMLPVALMRSGVDGDCKRFQGLKRGRVWIPCVAEKYPWMEFMALYRRSE